ncbi:hypothetical protein HZB96_02220 [Candidatus Gottesmanbacteria bacterium]|nr:hypothetical protein [Candidatus Gottesmanbacteria bacterium]MBI5452098.1 hypothetical protein [Candidatus Gottesmanbacteria bacterium]
MKKLKRIKQIEKTYVEDLPISKTLESSINDIARSLSKQIDKEIFNKKHVRTADILKLIGAGAFIAASLAIPNLPRILKPFLEDENEFEIWKRFNIPYLKRTLRRLEKEKLVQIKDAQDHQVVEITQRGRRRILKYALDEITVEKPKFWDGKWRLVSYDIPAKQRNLRKIFREYIHAWGFYPLHESVYLHAYPCEKQVEFLREYLGLGEYVRIFYVIKIENDALFRDFFSV